jgi:sortase A
MRRAGNALLIVGVTFIVWGAVVYFWGEPFTGLYERRQQGQLADDYEERERVYRPPAAAAESEPDLTRIAQAYRRRLPHGAPMGRLTVPRLDLRRIVVNGAEGGDLRRGPGRDLRSFMPGEGKLVYIAGHRTTYGAPFRHIDDLRRGDRIVLEVPYGRFVYRVTGHAIVKPEDVERLRPRGREELALQASHPPYSASRRYIAYARFVRVSPSARLA